MPEKDEIVPAAFEPIEKYQNLVGRLIIDVYKGNTQGRYNFTLKRFINECKIVQIMSEKYGSALFPGYKNLRIDYHDLYRGIYLNDNWKFALQLQKGVYVIVDKAPDSEYSGLGRIYIGSATSKVGLLYDRWKSYADTLTGGNEELKKVKNLKGEDYIKKYFQWTLIEHYNDDDKFIKDRESYWKKVLNSIEQGLNDN